MDSGTVVVITLIKFAFVILLIGWIPALIAKNKGRSFFGWWVYGGALFLVALIHALLIKPREGSLLEVSEKPVGVGSLEILEQEDGSFAVGGKIFQKKRDAEDFVDFTKSIRR